ncbi:MAG: hypothetical protein IJ133_01135 [Clostridia bacterium]|nr:hypothetical protein [Clostridia bacterium]
MHASQKTISRMAGAALAMVLIVTLLVSEAFAAVPTTKVELVLHYNQVSARQLVTEINQYRADKSAWYWNQDSKVRVKNSRLTQPVAYDYSLEKIAMQRLPELFASEDGKRPDHSEPTSLVIDGVKSDGEIAVVGVSTTKEVLQELIGKDDNYSAQPYRSAILSPALKAIGVAHAVYKVPNSTESYEVWLLEVGQKASETAATPAYMGDKKVSIDVANDTLEKLIPQDNSTYDWKTDRNGKVTLLRDGKPATDVTGLYEVDTGKEKVYMYLEKGVLRTDFNGVVPGTVNGVSGTWKVKNGQVDTKYSGTYKTKNGTVTIKNGKVV